MEISGRTALVTGAAGRVGQAVALAMAGRGMDIVVHYNRSASEARATAESVERLGQRAVTVRADLAEREEVDALADQAVQFLLEGSDFITGQVVVVDGGRSIK